MLFAGCALCTHTCSWPPQHWCRHTDVFALRSCCCAHRCRCARLVHTCSPASEMQCKSRMRKPRRGAGSPCLASSAPNTTRRLTMVTPRRRNRHNGVASSLRPQRCISTTNSHAVTNPRASEASPTHHEPLLMDCCTAMRRGYAARVVAMIVALALLAHQAAAQGWQRGRVTYFGAPAAVARAYDPTRGEGSFGILAYGSCGYTNSDGSLPFPRDQPAASADGSADYPGSCGRCYEMRCLDDTKVLDNSGNPIRISNGSYEGDRFRPVLEEIDPSVRDTGGRPFPGNPDRASNTQTTLCREDTRGRAILVRITDSCPCTQVLSENAPGVAKGGETRTQAWCCGSKALQHFDVSYWAFEQLAHPVFGVAMIQWRPVDCDTRAPLPVSPGFIDRATIYRGGPRPGWSWQPYDSSAATLITPSAPAPSGAASTCLTISPTGGLPFRCRECSRPGYQPFAGATAISFAIRSNARTASPFESSTPLGQLPDLKLILRKAESNNFCQAEPMISAFAPAGGNATAAANGGWWEVTVPTSAFDCGAAGGVTLAQAGHFEFKNVAERNAIVCIGDVRILRE